MKPPLLTRRRGALLLALFVPLLLAGFSVYPPTESSYYPRCLLHQLTGLHCPGCGATRCVYALLHGQIARALACNALLVFALPFLIVWGGCQWGAALLDRPAPRLRLSAWVVPVLTVVVFVYAVARNVPVFPFDLLVPPLPPEFVK